MTKVRELKIEELPWDSDHDKYEAWRTRMSASVQSRPNGKVLMAWHFKKTGRSYGPAPTKITSSNKFRSDPDWDKLIFRCPGEVSICVKV